MLEQWQVRAVFDLIGEQASRCPELVRRIAAGGHLIASHSYSHPFPIGPIRWIADQLEPTDRVIGEALGVSGYHSRYFRPPNGLLTPALHKAMRLRELRLLPVTFYAGDAEHGPATADQVLEKMLARLRRDEGGIIVLHDRRSRPFGLGEGDTASPRSGGNRTWVPGAVDTLLTMLQAEGFQFTIDCLEQMRV